MGSRGSKKEKNRQGKKKKGSFFLTKGGMLSGGKDLR